jgi:hypothetical protein
MATVKKIGTAGGGTRDYSTIALWLASVPSTPTGGYIGECYNDGSTDFTPASTIAFSGHTTSSADFITLRCASGQSFRDNASVQTNALRYNVSNGVGIKGSFGGNAALISIGEDYITVDGLQVWQSRAYAGGPVVEVTTTSATHSVISGNNLQGDGGDTTIMKSGVWRNNLVLANPSGGGKRFIAGSYPGTIVLANNTFASFSDAANPIGTVFGFFGTPTLSFTNNAIFGAGAMGTTTGITGNNTCSDLAISFGSNNQASKTYASQFTNTTIASGDFKVKNNSADLYDHGITDTTDIPAANDIALTSRPQGSTWDIGCWELVVGGGTQNITLTLATLKFAGFPLAVNGKSQFGIVQGALKFAGFALGANGRSQFPVTQALLKFVGFAMSANVGTVLSVIMAPLKFAGFAFGANAKSALNIVMAPIVFAGRALTLSGAVSLAIVQATIVFSGRVLNFVGNSVARMLALLGVGL